MSIKSVWDLERNDVDAAVWAYEHLPLDEGSLRALVLLQDDPRHLYARLATATRYKAPAAT